MHERLFRNREEYVIGVIKFDHENKPKGLPLDPNQTVWLNETEMRLTANAPATPEENPFSKGSLEELDPAERPIDAAQARPIPGESFAPLELPEEHGTEVAVDEQPPVEGDVAPEEEVATPEAQEGKLGEEAVKEVPTPVEGSGTTEPEGDSEEKVEPEGKVIPPEDKDATAKAKQAEGKGEPKGQAKAGK